MEIKSNLDEQCNNPSYTSYNIDNDNSVYDDFGKPDSLEKDFISKVYELYGLEKQKGIRKKIEDIEIKNPIGNFAIDQVKKILPKDKLEKLKNSIKFYHDRVVLIIGYDKRKIVIPKDQIVKIERNFNESLKAKSKYRPLSVQDIRDIKELLGEELTFKDLFPYLIDKDTFYWTGSSYDSHEKFKYFFDSNGNVNYQSGAIKLKTIYKKI